MRTQPHAFFANLACFAQQLRTRIRGAGMLDYAVIIGLIAVFSIVSLTSTGTNVSRLLCLASDGIRVHALGQEAQCPDETIVAEGPTEDNGGGQGAVVEPPVEDGFVFDTTGLVFPNIILDEGTTAPQTILTNFAGIYSTNVEYQVRRLEGSSPLDVTTTRSAVVTTAGVTTPLSTAFQNNAWTSWRTITPENVVQIGLAMTPPSAPTATLAALYEVALRPVGRPSLTETFTFSVSRVGGDVVFNPTIEVANITLPAGTVDDQHILFPLSGVFNTDLRYQVRRNGADNITATTYEQIQHTNGNVRYGDVGSGSFQDNATSMSSLIKPTQTQALGLRMGVSPNIFVDAQAQYDLLLWSVERPEDVRTFTFSVTRPAEVVVFEPTLAVENVVLAAGTTGLQTVHFPFGGTINTGITYQVRRLESTNMDERTYGSHRYQSTNYTAGFVAGNDTLTTTNTTWTVGLTQGTTQAGVRITPATNVYVDSFGAYEILMASVERPDDVRRFTFTITRPAQPVTFDPTFAVADVVLPAGATGSQTIQFPFGGTINTGITYQVRRLESVNMGDRTYTSYRYKETDYAPSSILGDDTLLNTTWTLDTVTNTTQAGVRITPSSNAFVDGSALYEVVIASLERPDDVRRFTFTVTRPAQAVVFEPTLAVEDVLLAAGSTGEKNIFFPLGGTFNTNILYKISRIDATNMANQTSGRYQTIPNSVWGAGFAQGNSTSAGTTWAPSALANITNVGIAITPSSNLFLESVGSYEILLASVERPDDVRRFPFTVTRPANPMAFDPQLATQDVVLAAGVSGEQSVTFPLTFSQPTTATNLLFDVRRVSATNLGTTTAPQFVRATDTVGTLTDFSNDTPSQQWTLSTSTKGLGVRIITPTDPFLDATGTYEIRVAPTDLPENVRVFTFTVTRPAQPLDFNLTLAAQDTTIPVGTTGTVEVLFDLTGTANTDARFTFERLSGPTPLAGWTYARHQNASGVVSNLGGSASATYTINSTIVPSTTRKLGVSLQMPTNTFEAAEASFRISLASTRTPTDVKTYTFTVTRTADTVRFNPVVAVQNTVLPIDTTGWQEVMFDLSGEFNTSYTYTLEQRNSTNLAATVSRYRNASGNITGSNNTGSNTLSIPSYTLAATSAQQLGVRVEFPTNPFIDARATYTLRLTSTQDPTQVRAFSFTLERTSKTLVFEPTLATQNVVLNEGTTGRLDVMFDLGGTINSDMVLRVQRTSGTLTGYLGSRVTTAAGAVTGSEFTTNTNALTFPQTYPASTRQVGVRVDVSANPYIEQIGAYEIHLHSPNNPGDVRIFPFTITRTPTPIIFNPSVAASTVTLPMGTTTRQQVLFDLTGEMNTSFVYRVRRLSGGTITGNTHGVVRTAANTTQTTSWESTNNIYTSPQNFPNTTQQVGVQLDLSSNPYIEQSSTYEIAMHAPDRPSDVRTRTFTVTRPAQPMTFTVTPAVQNITLPAGSTVAPDILFDLTGEADTSVVYTLRRVSSSNASAWSYPLARTNGTVTNSPGFVYENSNSKTLTRPATDQVGVRIPMPTHTNQDIVMTYEITLTPSLQTSPATSRSYTFTVTRPKL